MRPWATAFVALALVIPASAAAATNEARHLRDVRYCEIIEVKGTPPDATVVVWNTIGLGTCPQEEWEAFDAAALAEELGDTAVILNGPRHFLMDSVTARTGRTREFHGMRMTKVATIPIRTSAELAQTAYMDRTIARSNTWRWKRGRRVFELVAPGGDVYVMQSYAQIEDPDLTIADLPQLRRRLDLPDGWRYRSRKLRHRLVLDADGSATILQDDLRNTYQLRKATRPPGKRVRRAVSLEGTTRTVGSPGEGMVEDRGAVSGKPFGPGSLALVGTFSEGMFDATFRLLFEDGSIVGTTSLPYTITADEIDFVGVAEFTGGTGAYRGIAAKNLDVHDHNTLDGQNGTITLDGDATW